MDPNSAALVASCGDRGLHPDFGTVWDGAPNGIPYVVVGGSQSGAGDLRLRGRERPRAVSGARRRAADGRSGWYVSGAADPRWSDDRLATLRRVRSTDFEVIGMEGLVTP